MSIRRKKNGKYEADYSNLKRGISRTRRTFDTRKQADEWLAAVKTQAHNRLLGRRERHLFGEALARYLEDESPRKKTRSRDITDARMLRVPVKSGNHWIRLEEIYLDQILPAFAAWLAEMRKITRRRFIHANYYLQMPDTKGTLQWYQQPDTSNESRPQQRILITDQSLIAQLERPGGRGPYSSSTLRIKQALMASVLKTAWKKWDWLDQDLSGKIDWEKPAPGRTLFATPEQVAKLIEAASQATIGNQYITTPDPFGPHMADLIMGAVLIGWRKSNVVMLSWDRVVFPVYSVDKEGNKTELHHGVIWVDDPNDIKNKKPMAQPMSNRLEELLRRRWEMRVHHKDHGWLVFHNGKGAPFINFRKRFTAACRIAGLPANFRWHDLRHTWASHLIQSGAEDRHIQELGGWKDRRMVERYAHLRIEHLRNTVELPGNNRK